MSLIGLIIGIVVLLVAFWLISTYAPAEPPVRTILLIVLSIITLVWLLSALGVVNIGTIRVR